MIDEIDLKILTIVQSNARVPNTEIAKSVGMAPSAVLERLRKLEAAGIVKGYAAQLDPRQVRHGLAAFVFVRTDDRVGEARAGKALAEIPEIQEVHHVAGEDCFLVKVRVADTTHLAEILREKIGRIRSVKSTRTTIVLETVKESTILPLTAVRKEKKKRGE